MCKMTIIYLRQPSEKSDPRIDPLYNKGCFGSTGCHSKNVLRPNRKDLLRKNRLCFMQGGSEDTKIVYITPSISEIINVQDNLIIKWDSKWNEQNQRPLKYKYGLLLTNPLARKLNENIEEGKSVKELYQHFRSKTEPIDNPDNFITEYEKHVNKMEKKFGNKIFVNHNCETFEHINRPEFYIDSAIQWCSTMCEDKNCSQP